MCVVVNVVGMIDKKYDLSVYVFLSIIGNYRLFENISVVEKNLVFLICEVFGIFLFFIIWFKDGWFVNFSNFVRIFLGGRMLWLM